MKKIVLLVAMLIGSQALIQINAGESGTCTELSARASAEIYSVQAVRNPSAGVKVKATLQISWDGSECYVYGRDGNYFDQPIRASRSTTYSGYPWCVTLGNATWYFTT